eukprot:superscaffoldBa00006858_g21961
MLESGVGSVQHRGQLLLHRPAGRSQPDSSAHNFPTLAKKKKNSMKIENSECLSEEGNRLLSGVDGCKCK